MSTKIPFLARPLAVTDVETTGLDAARHEILEIGLLLVDQRTLKILDAWEAKVLPERPDEFEPEAIARNGYTPETWQDALPLPEAVALFETKVSDAAVFTAHNVRFDRSFIEAAYRKVGRSKTFHYQALDSFGVAWPAIVANGLQDVHLNTICRMLGLPEEPLPHRAMNGARCVHAVLSRMVAIVRAGLAEQSGLHGEMLG